VNLRHWSKELDNLDSRLPHGSNLRTKCFKKNSEREIKALNQVLPQYFKLREVLKKPRSNLRADVAVSVKAAEKYLKFLRAQDKVFCHQSDFLSSVIPELFYSIFQKWIAKEKPIFSVETQKQIIIECAFIPKERAIFKLKRVDVAVLLPCKLVVGKETINDFSIPLIAIEVKTNLDKNMISGIEHAVSSLKKTFPLCRYFVLSEFADFSVERQNYAGTAIDEVYVLRKMKRSVARKDGRLDPIVNELCIEVVEDSIKHLRLIVQTKDNLKQRMRLGLLIGKKSE